MTDQMVLQTQQWLNKTYGNDPRFKKINPDGRTGWPTIYALTRALQIELGIQSTADNFGPSTQRLFKQRYPNGVRQQAVADKSTSNVYSIIQGALWCKGYSTGGNISQHFYDGTGSAIRHELLHPFSFGWRGNLNRRERCSRRREMRGRHSCSGGRTARLPSLQPRWRRPCVPAWRRPAGGNCFSPT